MNMRRLGSWGMGLVILNVWGCASTPPPVAETPAAAGVPEAANPALVAATSADPKAASSATQTANDAVKQALPFSDTQDFKDVNRGFLGTWAEPTIKDATGRVVWDFEAFSFLKGEPPPEVNPSLWRMAQLNSVHGLFQVTDNILQVRGFDLSVTTFIEGRTGLVVVDPLLTKETAA